MTVAELIEALRAYPDDTQVCTTDPDGYDVYPVDVPCRVPVKYGLCGVQTIWDDETPDAHVLLIE